MKDKGMVTVTEAKRAFTKAFMALIEVEAELQPPVGIIEGEDGAPVMIQELCGSDEVDEAWKVQHGCGAKEEALFVEHVPATLWPRTNAAGERAAPEAPAVPRKEWLTFPKKYAGYPVYYRAGAAT